MAETTRIPGNLHVAGQLSSQTQSYPAGSITDAAIAAGATGAYITRTKVHHQQNIGVELYGPTTTVAALTKWLHIVRGAAATIVAFEAAIAVVATGADRTITVDLQKSTGGGAFATVLSATCGFTNGSTVRVPVAGTISSASLVDGDILQTVVTVAGAAGAQATGLTIGLTLAEEPQ